MGRHCAGAAGLGKLWPLADRKSSAAICGYVLSPPGDSPVQSFLSGATSGRARPLPVENPDYVGFFA